MQEENQSARAFSERTEKLAKRLGISLRALPPVIGISPAMLFAYRTGKNDISKKAWAKLQVAEIRASQSATRPHVDRVEEANEIVMARPARTPPRGGSMRVEESAEAFGGINPTVGLNRGKAPAGAPKSIDPTVGSIGKGEPTGAPEAATLAAVLRLRRSFSDPVPSRHMDIMADAHGGDPENDPKFDVADVLYEASIKLSRMSVNAAKGKPVADTAIALLEDTLEKLKGAAR